MQFRFKNMLLLMMLVAWFAACVQLPKTSKEEVEQENLNANEEVQQSWFVQVLEHYKNQTRWYSSHDKRDFVFYDTYLFQRPDSSATKLLKLGFNHPIEVLKTATIDNQSWCFALAYDEDSTKHYGFVPYYVFTERPTELEGFLYFLVSSRDYRSSNFYMFSQKENRFIDSIRFVESNPKYYYLSQDVSLANVDKLVILSYGGAGCGTDSWHHFYFFVKGKFKKIFTTTTWGEWNDDWGTSTVYLPVFIPDSNKTYLFRSGQNHLNSDDPEGYENYYKMPYPEDIGVPIGELVIFVEEEHRVKTKNGAFVVDKNGDSIYHKPKINISYCRWDGRKLVLIRKD